MPSSGYGLTHFIPRPDPDDARACFEYTRTVTYVNDCAQTAMRHGLLVEWLMSFLAAWEQTKDARVAAGAGIEEWDL